METKVSKDSRHMIRLSIPRGQCELDFIDDPLRHLSNEEVEQAEEMFKSLKKSLRANKDILYVL